LLDPFRLEPYVNPILRNPAERARYDEEMMRVRQRQDKELEEYTRKYYNKEKTR
jgi:hypothetical protein